MTDVLLTVDAGPGANNTETAELTLRLREELIDHDLDAVVPSSAAAVGTKGVGSADVAPILVVLATSGGVSTTFLGMLQAWLVRNSGSQIEVEVNGERIVLTPTSDGERRRALDFFLARHEIDGPKDAESGEHAPD